MDRQYFAYRLLFIAYYAIQLKVMGKTIKGLFKMYLINRKASYYDKMFNLYFDELDKSKCGPYFRALCRLEKLMENIHLETFAS